MLIAIAENSKRSTSDQSTCHRAINGTYIVKLQSSHDSSNIIYCKNILSTSYHLIEFRHNIYIFHPSLFGLKKEHRRVQIFLGTDQGDRDGFEYVNLY